MATIDGTSGNDTLIGASGSDTLNGLAGDDLLLGNGGDDALNGGEDDDVLKPGSGSPTLNGGAGIDTADLTEIAQGVIVQLADGTANSALGGLTAMLSSIENLLLGPGNDTVYGDAQPNRIESGHGNDLVLGGLGNDTILGGNGDDSLQGDQGDDSILGGGGSDIISVGPGVDTVVGGTGANTLYFVFDIGALFVDLLANSFVDGSGTSNVLADPENFGTVSGGSGNDHISGNAAANRLGGFTGNDTIFGLGGADTLTGNDGNDSLAGGDGDDSLAGGHGLDQLFGDAGNDSLSGDDDNDTLDGGGGSDTLSGGSGNDVLNAGTGSQALLMGGPGNDTLIGSQTLVAIASWADLPAAVMVDATLNLAFDTQGGFDSIVGCTSFLGSPQNDTMTGGAALTHTVEFYGGGGDDFFINGGQDIQPTGLVRVRYDFEPAGGTIDLLAQTATFPGHLDILVDIHAVVGTPFNDTIIGTFSEDNIDAGAGDDVLDIGVAANDMIMAGAGNDTVMLGLANVSATIDGGSGDDTFEIYLVTAPPPEVGPPTIVTHWQATDATRLTVSEVFNGTPSGSAVIGKEEGTLRILLDPFVQSFDVTAYQLDLLLVANGNMTGTLGQGDDTVIAAAGPYSLDGAGGDNRIDYAGVGSGIVAAFDGDQLMVQNGADMQTLQHFLSVHGSTHADTFTSMPFDAVTPFSASDMVTVVESGLPADAPTVVGGGGGDSYRGRLIVDYRAVAGTVMIGPSVSPELRQATVAGGTDSLRDVAAVLLPAAGSTVDYGTNRNVLLQVTGGNNRLDASPGSLLSYATFAAGLDIDLAEGHAAHGNGNDTIAGVANLIGGSGDDTITGDDQDNLLAPAGGSNTVEGGEGADTLVLGYGLSAVVGHVYLRDGERLLFATAADGPVAAQEASHVESGYFDGELVAIADFARALPDFADTTALDAGDPVLFAGLQNDAIEGSAGADFVLDPGGANRVDGGGGSDLLRMTGGSTAAQLAADLPPDLVVAAPTAGDDELLGGEGADTILAGPGADIVDGGPGNDVLFGEGGADSLTAGDGDDVLFGDDGDDLLFGEDGDDALFGFDGQDVLVGGTGDDRLYVDGDDLAAIGGGGYDTLIILETPPGFAAIDLRADEDQNQGNAGPALSGFEAVNALGATRAMSLHGALYEGAGSVLVGGAFHDTLTGGDGDDTLVGSGGNDVIDGGLGDDRLILDAGNDTASGGSGSGSDDFVYSGGPGSGAVQLVDFVPGEDRLVLSDSLASDGGEVLWLLRISALGTLIDFGDGRSITLVGVALPSLQAGDFLVETGL